jgi:tubulin delta
VGQCGVQLGDECLGELHKYYQDNHLPGKLTFFDENNSARAILVDTETKVVNGLLESQACKKRAWKYDPAMSVVEHGGAANNWAYGYKKKASQSVGPKVLECIRKNVEACDCLGGFQIIGSAAGGTGSGVGSYLTEALWDEYAATPSVHIIVLPFDTGEVAVQSLNATLSLGHLVQNGGGGTIIARNDVAAEACRRRLDITHPTLGDLNGVIARNVVSMLVGANGRFFQEVVPQLWNLPNSYPFAQVKSVPQTSFAAVDFTNDSWYALEKELSRGTVESFSASLFLHGERQTEGTKTGTFFTDKMPAWAKISPKYCASETSLQLYNPWRCYESAGRVRGYERAATLATNSTSMIEPLSNILSKATDMLEVGAYVHQYEMHGVTVDDFKENVMRLDRIVAMYGGLK